MTIGLVHFIRPEWLLLAPLVVVLWYILNRQNQASQWQNYLPQKTLEVLRVKQLGSTGFLKWCLLCCCLLIVIATAGPSWIKQNLPLVQNQRALVILLDVSPSMSSTDIKPDRISRARYELLDALRLFKDGQLGLVAYAGSAHIVSPLTDDPASIRALVPTLSPSVMPQQGSNIEAALELAQRLLDDAGIQAGELLLISDGIPEDIVEVVANTLRNQRRLSILGVGGTEPTPIPSESGGFVRNSNGEIVLSELTTDSFRKLAHLSGGKFATVQNSDADITALIDNTKVSNQSHQAQDRNSESSFDSEYNDDYDSWADMGFIFVILALPLVLYLFRKGALFIVMLAVFLPMTFDAQAADFGWRDLFETKDKQAAELMSKGQYAEAATVFKRKDWSAAAHFRNGDYDKTIEQLEGSNDVLSLYNKATAMAMSGKLPEAIETYEQVLVQQPEHANAAHNKKVLEDVLKQQEQQGDQTGQEQKDQKNSNSSTNNNDADQQQKENTNEQQESDQQANDDKNQGEKANEETSQQEQHPDRTSSENANSEDTQALSEQHEEQIQDSQETDKDKDKNTQASKSEEQGQTIQEQKDESLQVQESSEPFEEVTPLSANSEQWLRGIEDDPAGLLRRKFEYQARQADRQANPNADKAPAPSSQERY